MALTTIIHKEIRLCLHIGVYMFVLRVALQAHDVEACVYILALSAGVRDQPRRELATIVARRTANVLHQGSVIFSQIWYSG